MRIWSGPREGDVSMGLQESWALVPVARALLLLVVANSAPWVAARVLGRRWEFPLDCGWVLRDGRRLFGGHKTWRGLVASAAACEFIARSLGLPWATGAAFGAVSLLGDAISSGLKRRLALPPGTEVPGLDQFPEALLPLLVLAPVLDVGLAQIFLITLLFLILNLLAMRLRHPDPR